VSDKTYKKLKEEGKSLKEIIKATGMGTNCGTCIKHLKREKDNG
jgi:bacterioferritin-associated ferredoxin